MFPGFFLLKNNRRPHRRSMAPLTTPHPPTVTMSAFVCPKSSARLDVPFIQWHIKLYIKATHHPADHQREGHLQLSALLPQAQSRYPGQRAHGLPGFRLGSRSGRRGEGQRPAPARGGLPVLAAGLEVLFGLLWVIYFSDRSLSASWHAP